MRCIYETWNFFHVFFRIEVDVFSLRKDIKSEITNLLTRSMKMNKIKSAVAVAAVLISAAKVIVEGLEKVKGDKLIGNSDNTEPATNV